AAQAGRRRSCRASAGLPGVGCRGLLAHDLPAPLMMVTPCELALAAPVPGDETAVRARPDVDVDEVAAIATDAAELGLLQRPGMQLRGAHAGDAEVRCPAQDVLRSVAAAAAAPAVVAVDPAVVAERAIARDHLDLLVELPRGTAQDRAQRFGQWLPVR